MDQVYTLHYLLIAKDEAIRVLEKRIKELEDGKNKRFREMEEALAAIYESRATHCQGCKEHGQIAKAALTGEVADGDR